MFVNQSVNEVLSELFHNSCTSCSLIYNRLNCFALLLDELPYFKDETIIKMDGLEISENSNERTVIMSQEMMNYPSSIFQQYKAMLADWIPTNASIAIAVNDTYVYFASGDEQIKLAVGQKVNEDSITHLVLTTRKKTDAVMETTLFDKPYYGVGYPIEIEGQPASLVVVLPHNFIKPKQELYQFLTGRHEETWIPVPIGDISYIESLQKRTWFYVKGEQFKTSITLKELQTKLPNYFIRIHRSYIINIYFIQSITRDITSNFVVLMKDGTELPISQSYVNEVRKVLEF